MDRAFSPRWSPARSLPGPLAQGGIASRIWRLVGVWPRLSLVHLQLGWNELVRCILMESYERVEHGGGAGACGDSDGQ